MKLLVTVGGFIGSSLARLRIVMRLKISLCYMPKICPGGCKRPEKNSYNFLAAGSLALITAPASSHHWAATASLAQICITSPITP